MGSLIAGCVVTNINFPPIIFSASLFRVKTCHWLSLSGWHCFSYFAILDFWKGFVFPSWGLFLPAPLIVCLTQVASFQPSLFPWIIFLLSPLQVMFCSCTSLSLSLWKWTRCLRSLLVRLMLTLALQCERSVRAVHSLALISPCTEWLSLCLLSVGWSTVPLIALTVCST